MKERPILFNADMVNAILAGRKTQTRRIVKNQPNVPVTDAIPRRDYPHGPATINWYWRPKFGHRQSAPSAGWDFKCPYGQPGDRLWVRETTEIDEDSHDIVVLARYSADKEPVLYSSCEDPGFNGTVAHWDYPRRSRPSIHMPRWASRITLEIVSVRVERLQDISEVDAQKEGAFFTDYGRDCFHHGAPQDVGQCTAPSEHHPQRNGWAMKTTDSHEQCLSSARMAFANLWLSINGPDSWNANPWVWVVEFKQV